jgi:hypothetical protein
MGIARLLLAGTFSRSVAAGVRAHQDAAALSGLALVFACCAWRFFGILQLDVDVGRDYVVAELLLQGKTLYRDVVYLYGPLAPWLDSSLFRIFGVSVQVLLAAGTAAALLIVALTYAVARQVLPPAASLVSALIVAVHAAYGPDIMSYAAPYTLSATYGLLFSLLALYALLRALERPALHWDLVAGASAALAFAAKQDFGVISLAMLLASFFQRRPFKSSRTALAAAVTFGAYALVIGIFASTIFLDGSRTEFLSNFYPRQSLAAWSRLYGQVGGWGPQAWTRILQTVKGFALNFAFLVWAACAITLLVGFVRGERCPATLAAAVLAASLPLTWHYWPLRYYPLLLHGVVFASAIATAAGALRLKVGFLAFCAAVFFARLLPYPKSDGYGLLYFVPSLIVYLYLML